MDDDEHKQPTKENMIAAYKSIVADSEPGDAIFLHYSGKSNNYETGFLFTPP
jgi:Caspase domain